MWHDARREIVAGKRSQHEDIAMSEIDEAQNAVDHGVAQSDEGVEGAEGKSVDDLLGEFGRRQTDSPIAN